MFSRHSTYNLITLVLADSQRKYFDTLLEEHCKLTLFHSGDKIEDLFPKYKDMIPSFDCIIVLIRNNYSRDDEVIIMTKM